MGKYQKNATLVSRELLNDELMVLRIAPDEADDIFNFKPGQYAEVSVIEDGPDAESTCDRVVRRQFSIASASGDSEGLEFYIVLVPNGFLTPKLWNMEVGSRLWMNPKVKGKFTLDPVPAGKDLVMIATGTGLAPFVSMLRTYREDPSWRRFVIIHGSRLEKDLGYRQQLEALAEEDERFFYISTLTREEEGSAWKGHRGRVGTVLEDGTYEERVGAPFAPEDCQVFLCGNPAMIDELQTQLDNRGFKLHKKKDPGNLHVERYW